MSRRAGRSPRGIYYEFQSEGGKPPLVLLMGYASGLAAWGEHFLSRVGERHSYLVLDNRGTGQSTRNASPDEYSIRQMADDAASAIGEAFAEPVHLVGYSMGGCIAQDIALDGKLPVARLTLIASTAGGAHYTSPGAAVLKALSEPQGDKLLDYFEASWRICMGEDTMRRHWDELLEIFAEQSKNLTPRSAMKGHLLAYIRFAASDRLPTLRVPTTIVHGVEDPLTPCENARALHRLIPGSRLELLAGVKHNPHLEAPGRLLQLIENT